MPETPQSRIREADRDRLRRGLEELGWRPGDAQIEALLALASLLHSWAARLNLTAHRSPEAILDRLVLEAAALGAQLPEAVGVADLGSGAGFPGLPLAVLSPERRFTLVESRLRRHHFQRAAVRELGLTNVRTEHGRAEDLPADPHPLVVAQAMARPSVALPWMIRWAEPGGWLAIPGGAQPPPVPEHPSIQAAECRSYRSPRGDARTVWLARVRTERRA